MFISLESKQIREYTVDIEGVTNVKGLLISAREKLLK